MGIRGVSRRGRMAFLLEKAERLEASGQTELARLFRRMAGDLEPLPTAARRSAVYFSG